MKIHTTGENLPYYRKYLTLIEETKDFFKSKNYLEIITPLLSPALIPESYLEIFETEYRYFNKKEKLYLTPSPELFMKRLLAQGVGDSYYLGKAFRNSEQPSTLHMSEFTMLEFYKVHANYFDIAETVLDLVRHLASALHQNQTITYKGVTVSFDEWERISVSQAFEKYAGISDDVLFTKDKFFSVAEKKGYAVKNFTYEDVFSQLYVQEIEPKLGMNGKPTLLYDYPKEFAALAELNSDGKTAQRFEFYIAGVELGDCYTELIDASEQETRFKEQEYMRKTQNKIAHTIDKDYIKTLQYGLVPCAGIAIGFDRLAMVLSGADTIKQLQLLTIE